MSYCIRLCLGIFLTLLVFFQLSNIVKAEEFNCDESKYDKSNAYEVSLVIGDLKCKSNDDCKKSSIPATRETEPDKIICWPSIPVGGTCTAGAVLGSKEPLVVEDKCTKPGYKPRAFEVSGFRAEEKCECIPESDSTPASPQLCAQEFQSCETDAQCVSGGPACENHVCVDIDPTEGTTKKCIAPDSPYGKQYSKTFKKTATASGVSCDLDNGRTIRIERTVGDNNEITTRYYDKDNNATEVTRLGIMTAIGCVPTEPQPFIEGIMKFISFAAGGVAFLLMILGALQMITAEGNPENIKAAQEKFYSAIIGLLFIIFAVLLLQVIGYDILGLPEFSR